MHLQQKKGILISVIIYGISIIIAFVLYLTIEHSYIHAPGLHHAVLILLFYIAVIWCIISSLLAIANKNRPLQIGFLIVNGTYILFCILFILYVTLDYKMNY